MSNKPAAWKSRGKAGLALPRSPLPPGALVSLTPSPALDEEHCYFHEHKQEINNNKLTFQRLFAHSKSSDSDPNASPLLQLQVYSASGL